MATTSTAITACGKVTEAKEGIVKFVPKDTPYELHVASPSYSGPLNRLVDGMIRVTARKAYTVPSGGNFITPIYGTPRIIQGRVRAVEGNSIVLQAGTPIQVQLPDEASAVELANGPITVGSLVNVIAQPGASFQLVP